MGVLVRVSRPIRPFDGALGAGLPTAPVTHAGTLYLRAEVTDDRVSLKADGVRLVDDRGRVVAPRSSRSRAAGMGYVWEGRYALAGLPRAKDTGEDDPILRVCVEVVDTDTDAPGRSTVISTSRGGRAYPAAIRLAPTTGLPLLSQVNVR